jgi:iron complex outermembrane receptor protein
MSVPEATVKGRIILSNGQPAPDVQVRAGNSKAKTSENGQYTLSLAPGKYTIQFSGLSVKQGNHAVELRSGQVIDLVDTLQMRETRTEDITVYGASRRQQKITEAPAAVAVLLPKEIERAVSHGQVAKSIEGIQGVDVVQSGMNDFNVNMRGFNNSINRRVLVLLDGRDPSTPLLNLVEWNSFQTNMGDVSKIEVVRGPGSALYGPNAYNGVINIISAAPKDVLGTKVSLTGGDFNTFRGDIRHAGEFGDFSYKINAGYSTQRQSWVRSRDTSAGQGGSLEYPGLQSDLNGNRQGIGFITNVDSLINANKNATNLFGSARVDYALASDKRLTAEMGFSRYGGEYFVNQTGRILINDVEKPYIRLAYNSEEWNVQAHWNRRNTITPQIVMNARATSAERSDVYVIDAQWNKVINSDLRIILGASHEYQAVNTTVVNATPLLRPDGLHNNFSGFYGQVEYRLLPELQIVGAARIDRSTFFETQFSPKGALVFTPFRDHTFRFTVNRSFLRPSYPDAYRRSPAGAPLALDSLDKAIAAQYNVQPLGLTSVPQWNLGNPQIKVETALSYEFGYKGILNKDLFVTVDAYMNRRTNFISVPLGGLAPSVYTPVRYTSAEANAALQAALAQRRLGAIYDRLAIYPVTGQPASIIVPTNIGIIDEYGIEIGVNYYALPGLLVQANYSYLDFNVAENTLAAQKIVPNTSPHRLNLGLNYESDLGFDVGVQVRGVKGFTWIAGLVEGYVPEYWLVNLQAGYNVNKELRISGTVFNVLDRRHYQIFGGTILQRMSSLNVTYSF